MRNPFHLIEKLQHFIAARKRLDALVDQEFPFRVSFRQRPPFLEQLIHPATRARPRGRLLRVIVVRSRPRHRSRLPVGVTNRRISFPSHPGTNHEEHGGGDQENRTC
jgi:hypothetical protein